VSASLEPLMNGSRYLGTLAALLLALSAGCGSSDPAPAPEPGVLSLELSTADGSELERFRLVITSDGETTSQSCPGAATVKLRCSVRGVDITSASAGSQVVVKVPGYHFEDLELTAAELEAGERRLELKPLPPFEAKADYVTGVAASDDPWAELAVTTATELGAAQSIKFLITELDGEPRVYLQNTRKNPLHYEFAQRALGLSQSRAEFAARTYQGESRPQMAGTLTRYPDLAFDSRAHQSELSAPIALEFFPSDDLSPRLALRAHRLLEERLLSGGLDGSEQRLVYVPAGSFQESSLRAAEAEFVRQDALFAEHVEFYAGVEQQILNPGLAYGTLLRVSPEELKTRVVSFRDVLLLTRLPNDLPLVGGTISEELQTPLAHVNLAARARGTPNLALRGAADDERVRPLLGKLVRFEVRADGFSLAAATLDEAQAFWDSRAGEPLVPESDLEFDKLSGFEQIAFGDSRRFGAKAANLAELRRLLGERAPVGFGVPFGVYHRYLRDNPVIAADCTEARLDCEEEGRAAELCESAELRCTAAADAGESFYDLVERLLADVELSTDAPQREACLDGLAWLVQHGEVDPEFADELDARVSEIFGTAKVRLRSSTNAEDLPGFSGAGLYESVSAEGSGDRRPSRRIREVWASTWRFRAFEERSLWNVDHRAIEMAVAVNAAVDDEVANGVLITQDIANPGAEGLYVNVQQGEVEVTNPESGAVPEVFSIVPAPADEYQVVRQRFSSLSPEAPLLADGEIAELARAAREVQVRFAALYQRPVAALAMDLEFKFHGPERKLLIKQARPYLQYTSP
jgi:pyruvate, water dikinase